MTHSISSYVSFEDKCFNVSTIERECSSPYAHGCRYNETTVWEWNTETRERGEMIYQGEAYKDSLWEHNRICEHLYQTGTTGTLDD